MTRYDHQYKPQQIDGEKAEPGTKCPWGVTEIGARCAWLAGHYDKYGLEAWEKARR